MELIHVIVLALGLLGSFFLYHQKLREDLINQRISMIDAFNREHADNCLSGLKEIKETLKNIKDQITEHTITNSALQIEMERMKRDLTSVDGKVNHMERLFEAFAIKQQATE